MGPRTKYRRLSRRTAMCLWGHGRPLRRMRLFKLHKRLFGRRVQRSREDKMDHITDCALMAVQKYPLAAQKKKISKYSNVCFFSNFSIFMYLYQCAQTANKKNTPNTTPTIMTTIAIVVSWVLPDCSVWADFRWFKSMVQVMFNSPKNTRKNGNKAHEKNIEPALVSRLSSQGYWFLLAIQRGRLVSGRAGCKPEAGPGH